MTPRFGWRHTSSQAALEKHPDLIGATSGRYVQTPLHVAADNGQIEVAKLLLENGADVNARDEGTMPYPYIMRRGQEIWNWLSYWSPTVPRST